YRRIPVFYLHNLCCYMTSGAFYMNNPHFYRNPTLHTKAQRFTSYGFTHPNQGYNSNKAISIKESINVAFDYDLDYKNLDLRKHPELYRVGKGEQGVLLVEPYKSEILPHWRFKTPEIAQESCDKISEMFEDYRKQDDFVGMD